jgi:thiamine biosynthesis lipoprotein
VLRRIWHFDGSSNISTATEVDDVMKDVGWHLAVTCIQAGMLSTLAMLQGKGAETFLSAQDVSYWCDRG